ncbi:MAG: ATP-dependent helicase HrpB [Bacteroidia bacterium]|nr:ATP-dependent helicase HrpB [Bacteroidia bacterium]
MNSHLPIQEVIPDVRKSLSEHNLVILQAPPGAGKSTLLPIHLLKEPWLEGRKILMLEPRRLAAKAVASRLAQNLNEDTGETIGFRIRFENRISQQTQLEVLTEGILTRIVTEDQTLDGIGLVIFDEFHERSIHADVALALCAEVQSVLRPDLRILIMSATLDTGYLHHRFPDAPIIRSEGRMFPVTMNYFKEEERTPITSQVTRLVRLALDKEEGDILCFLPGAGEIRKAAELLESETAGVSIVPLYGDLGWREQQEAILPDPAGLRKVVLATSIAETSLTIEGIKVVVDSGYSRVPRFNPNSGLTRLETIKVSKDTADQRAGRAGRLGPGAAYRLWEEGKTQYLLPHRKPEILEADLAPLALDLLRWGKNNLQDFKWVTPPPEAHLQQALSLLHDLGAYKDGKLTSEGVEMSGYPTHPRLARMFLESKRTGHAALAGEIAALLEERNPIPKEKGVNLALSIEWLRNRMEKYSGERVVKAALEWKKRLGVKEQSETISDSEIGYLLAFAFPDRIARKISGSKYRLANGKTASLEDYDPLTHEEWIVAAHLDAGRTDGKIFLAAPLDPTDIVHLASEREIIDYDERKDEIICSKEIHLGAIVLESKPIKNPPPDQLRRVLHGLIKKKGSALFGSDERTQQLRARLSILHHLEAQQWPDLSDASLLLDIPKYIDPFLEQVHRVSDLKKIPLSDILLNALPWDLQQKLPVLLPEFVEVPSGSQIRLEYHDDGRSPVLAVRLQELFGMLETPAILNGKLKIMVHLLSPGYKPVQVTQDLKSFWSNTYHEVRKELRIRYPRHSWPDDPFTAKAIRGVVKKKR